MGPVMTISDVQSRKIIKTIRFPDNIRVFVLNKDSSKIYANNNNFLGFLIADVKSGRVIKIGRGHERRLEAEMVRHSSSSHPPRLSAATASP